MSIRRVIARGLVWAAIAALALAASGAALFYYLIDVPPVTPPTLSGTWSHGTLDIGGLHRTYELYRPANFAPGAPVLLALHGSDGDAARLRLETGYAFERQADQHGFALVYPNGFEGNWNGCNIVGDYTANTRNIDDVVFLSSLTQYLSQSIKIDPRRVFAVGVSRGGHMAYRLALEAPDHFRAVAAVAANVPVASNFKCVPKHSGRTSVMIVNGIEDPLNPFDGGDVRIFGLFSRGSVMSAHRSAQFFADLDGIAAAPGVVDAGDESPMSRSVWRGDGAEVELIGVRGGGHSLPQPYRRAPRILGPTVTEIDGAEEIWRFFARQSSR